MDFNGTTSAFQLTSNHKRRRGIRSVAQSWGGPTTDWTESPHSCNHVLQCALGRAAMDRTLRSIADLVCVQQPQGQRSTLHPPQAGWPITHFFLQVQWCVRGLDQSYKLENTYSSQTDGSLTSLQGERRPHFQDLLKHHKKPSCLTCRISCRCGYGAFRITNLVGRNA